MAMARASMGPAVAGQQMVGCVPGGGGREAAARCPCGRRAACSVPQPRAAAPPSGVDKSQSISGTALSWDAHHHAPLGGRRGARGGAALCAAEKPGEEDSKEGAGGGAAAAREGEPPDSPAGGRPASAQEPPAPSSSSSQTIFTVADLGAIVQSAATPLRVAAANDGAGQVAAYNSRAGLYRTPNSGGVQSATQAHGLPSPAVAVRNLIEQARYAHLCTVMSRMHHRRRGYPFGSLVDFAPDETGRPIFSLSPLAIHTRNLLSDPRCTLVVQMPGWSGLANARVTLFGDVYPLPRESQEWAQQVYAAKHHHGASQKWGNFYFYRMESISDIYFVGGFGTVAWVDVHEYSTSQPDRIAASNAEETLQELNGRFSNDLQRLLSSAAGAPGGKPVDDAALISIDSKGVDIRVRQGAQFNVQRISFEVSQPVETLDQAIAAMRNVVNRAG